MLTAVVIIALSHILPRRRVCELDWERGAWRLQKWESLCVVMAHGTLLYCPWTRLSPGPGLEINPGVMVNFTCPRAHVTR